MFALDFDFDHIVDVVHHVLAEPLPNHGLVRSVCEILIERVVSEIQNLLTAEGIGWEGQRFIRMLGKDPGLLWTWPVRARTVG